MLFQIILTCMINPSLLYLSRDVIKNSQLDFIPSLLREKQFSDTVEGLTIFVGKKYDNQTYKNIFIRDEGKVLSKVSGADSSTIFAKSGHMSDDKKKLILYNGNIQKLNKGT